MHRSMPKNNRLLFFLPMLPRLPTSLASTLGAFLLLIAEQVESMNRPVLITLPNLKLLRIVRESTDKIVPVVKVIGVVMVRIKPGQIRQVATLVQSVVVS